MFTHIENSRVRIITLQKWTLVWKLSFLANLHKSKLYVPTVLFMYIMYMLICPKNGKLTFLKNGKKAEGSKKGRRTEKRKKRQEKKVLLQVPKFLRVQSIRQSKQKISARSLLIICIKDGVKQTYSPSERQPQCVPVKFSIVVIDNVTNLVRSLGF